MAFRTRGGRRRHGRSVGGLLWHRLHHLSTTSGGAYPDITRSFVSFSAAAHENALSRVLAGIHYRASIQEGLRMGQRIGDYVFQSYLKPSAVAEHGGRAAPPSGWPPRWSRARVAGQAGSSLNP